MRYFPNVALLWLLAHWWRCRRAALEPCLPVTGGILILLTILSLLVSVNDHREVMARLDQAYSFFAICMLVWN